VKGREREREARCVDGGGENQGERTTIQHRNPPGEETAGNKKKGT